MGKPDPEGSLGAAGAATLPRIDVRPQTHLWPLMDLHTIKHPMGFYHADEPVLTLLKIAAIATREPHMWAGKHEELNGKVKNDFRDLEFLLDRMVKEGKMIDGELQSAILDRGGEEKGGLWEEFWKRTERYGPKESGNLQSLFGKVNVKFEEPK
ncbi:hypothetical protein BDQ12DRAFT_688241 [Crucibulum laeve]|uniref:Uncharacterized protein n=1 Tax=Crucibulum laeve TaxID=68775 RepID=A0A5C3LRV3_9AGAR|nr:hypothetical protein BDQ12DRAFT_688241 [Crucibulum laeve]